MLYWFLPGIILLGIITTYTDLKKGKIRNKHIIMAMTYSLVAYLVMILPNLGTVRTAYFVELIVMCLTSLITGFIVWHVGLWTAGDAKLFFAYSLLTPLSVYKYGYIPYFSSTNILINTFVPVFIFLTATLLFKTDLKQKLLFLKKSFTPRHVLSLAVFLFAFTWLINIMFSFIKIPPDYFLMVFTLFLAMTLFEKITMLRAHVTVTAIGILRLIFDASFYSTSYLKEFLLLLIVFIVLRFFILHLGFYSFTKEIDIKLLKKGMIPAEAIYEEKGKYKKQELIFSSLYGYLEEKTKKRNYLIEPVSEGLTEEEIKKLKRLENKFSFEHLRVQQTTAFAPFIFLGALLTIVFQGNAFIAIWALL